MASYVMLINWTDQGAHGFRDTVDDGKGLADVANGLGGSLDRIVWTMGAYDAVAVLTAPDDETAAAMSLALAEGGTARTVTLRAFEQADMERIAGLAH
jgi:uncharacterized protein with GYD domain